jgi:hypothetical protein
MKLSDQIALLRETLEEFGGIVDGKSVGENAARLLLQMKASGEAANETLAALYASVEESEFQDSTQSDKDRIAELVDELDRAAKRILELEVAPAADGKCDSCSWLKTTGQVPRLCQNPEAWRHGFAKRGYSVPAGHSCEDWTE